MSKDIILCNQGVRLAMRLIGRSQSLRILSNVNTRFRDVFECSTWYVILLWTTGHGTVIIVRFFSDKTLFSRDTRMRGHYYMDCFSSLIFLFIFFSGRTTYHLTFQPTDGGDYTIIIPAVRTFRDIIFHPERVSKQSRLAQRPRAPLKDFKLD